ncbi:MAG TPA: acyl-CoA carboxylase epsilon subunit [Nocardioidaceae bacterium]|nr:acyl-CoA carboxylase epsilon subunit [Nocardioidaceae bacterium]
MSTPLVVIKGDATPEEVAAVVAVLQAASAGGAAEAPAQKSEWAANHRKVRASYPHGPGGWRSSALPR